jgi:hypothetical protein
VKPFAPGGCEGEGEQLWSIETADWRKRDPLFEVKGMAGHAFRRHH